MSTLQEKQLQFNPHLVMSNDGGQLSNDCRKAFYTDKKEAKKGNLIQQRIHVCWITLPFFLVKCLQQR